MSLSIRNIFCYQNLNQVLLTIVKYVPVTFACISIRVRTEILVLIALSSNEGSGESVHMHRLARAFAARIYKVQM